MANLVDRVSITPRTARSDYPIPSPDRIYSTASHDIISPTGAVLRTPITIHSSPATEVSLGGSSTIRVATPAPAEQYSPELVHRTRAQKKAMNRGRRL
jgi:hypothetical protein